MAATSRACAPGFTPQFSSSSLLAALVANRWIWLVRWRTGRHREALWKSFVLPAGGGAVLAVFDDAGLPILDYARAATARWSSALPCVPPPSRVGCNKRLCRWSPRLEYFGPTMSTIDRRGADRGDYPGAKAGQQPNPSGWSKMLRKHRPHKPQFWK